MPTYNLIGNDMQYTHIVYARKDAVPFFSQSDADGSIASRSPYRGELTNSLLTVLLGNGRWGYELTTNHMDHNQRTLLLIGYDYFEWLLAAMESSQVYSWFWTYPDMTKCHSCN